MSDSDTPEELSLNYDVVIAGAGIAGLSAARELKQRVPKLKILLLEAKNRIGGRLVGLPMRTPKGTEEIFDFGGQWVGRTQHFLLDLLKELDIGTFDQYAKGMQCSQIGTADIRKYNATLPARALRYFSFSEVLDFGWSLRKIERIARKIDLFNVFGNNNAESLNESSAASWVTNNVFTRTTSDLFSVAVRSVYCVSPNSLNMLYHAVYAKSAGSFMDLCEDIGNGAQAMKAKGGMHQVCPRLAAEFGEDNIRLSSPITKVEHSEQHGTTKVYFKEGDNEIVVGCTQVILAIPPTECAKIEFEPQLPYPKRRLLRSMIMGHAIKFIATFQRPFWREDGYSGEIFSSGYSTEPGEVFPVVFTYDATSSDGTPALVGFLNEEFTDMTMEERCNHVINDIVRFFGEKAVNEFVDYKDKVWVNEPYNGGCPVAVVPPGHMDAWLTIRDPHYTVHFGGTETATSWIGYIDGAIQSGMRCAHEVLHQMQYHQHVTYSLLKNTVYDSDFVPARPASRHYLKSNWKRKLFFYSLLFLGVYAFSVKYNLSYAAKAVKPVENALLNWIWDIQWPT